MSQPTSNIGPWSATEVLRIESSKPKEIVAHGKPQLSGRDMTSIVHAFEAGSYEMAATFIWIKAASVLKRQVASLGMEFVGEMLKRPDLDETSDAAKSLSDVEAISLAEDLGIVTKTQSLRLTQAHALVTHFSNLDPDASEDDPMAQEEAIVLLKTCVAAILARPNFEGALKFADFRKRLASQTLRTEECTSLTGSPYFFLRTTLSVLLALIKTQKGASQEHAMGNLSVILPLLWPQLRQPEKWQVGQAYAEIAAEGNRKAVTGVRAALLKVHGFDFVPESLRSNTFTEAAANVLSAHFGMNNFYNEEKPMTILSNLGTAIPKPAFAKCMEATLAVWLGNQWGNAFAAEVPARNILNGLRSEQWEYYINECLRDDKTILDKLAYDAQPTARWFQLVATYLTSGFVIPDKLVMRLMEATSSKDVAAVHSAAIKLRLQR